MQLRPFTEWEELTHVVLSIDTILDPALYDSIPTGDDTWYKEVADFANDDISMMYLTNFVNSDHSCCTQN